LAGGLTFLRDQQKSQVKTLRLATGCGGLLFDLKDDIHDRIRKIGFSRRA